MSNTGITLLTHFENFRDTAYKCQAGVWTIGWGTTRVNGQPVREGMTCTRAQAMEWKTADIAVSESALARLLPSVKLEPHQHDAVVSFIYNCGVGAFESSTLRKRLRGDGPVEERHFTDWNKARVNGVLTPSNGLTRRRKAEYHLYRTGALRFDF